MLKRDAFCTFCEGFKSENGLFLFGGVVCLFVFVVYVVYVLYRSASKAKIKDNPKYYRDCAILYMAGWDLRIFGDIPDLI